MTRPGRGRAAPLQSGVPELPVVEDRVAHVEPRVGQVGDEALGIEQRVQGIAAVPDHERRHLEPVAIEVGQPQFVGQQAGEKIGTAGRGEAKRGAGHNLSMDFM